MKYKHFIIFILVFCLALPPAFLGSLATIVNAANLNAAPIAYDQTIQGVIGYYTAIELTGYDPDGDPLTYQIITYPEHGNLFDDPPNYVYRPHDGYIGPDYIVFTASDGVNVSEPATITINVRSNVDPIGYPQTVQAVSGYYTSITLTGYDADDDPLIFIVVTPPQHGTLSGTAPNLTYFPDPGYIGPDFLEFVVSDDIGESPAIRVDINVRTNTDPIGYPQTIQAVSGYYTSIVLTGYDADGDPLTFLIVTNPQHGVLLYDFPNYLYRPDSNYVGSDFFEFVVSDGIGESPAVRVDINVRSNTDPIGYPQTVQAVSGVNTPITLTGYDADDDPLIFIVVTPPQHGTLSGTAPNLTYFPDPGYIGPDFLEFVVSDDIGESPAIRVDINVRTNTDPIGYPQTIQAVSGYYTSIVLTGYDADGDPLTFLIVTNPQHGVLLYDFPNYLYRPDSNYVGSDFFEFVVSDGIGESPAVRVDINVRSNTDPIGYPQTVQAVSGVNTPITLTGYDADDDPLIFIVVTPPQHGTLSGTAPNLTYFPDPGYIGPDFLEFVVSDDIGESPAIRVDINVVRANSAPVANPQSLIANSGVPLSLILTGSDPDGDTLSFQVTAQPTHGVLSGTAPNLTYTSALGYLGPDSFQFVVSDGTLSSSPATVSITVSSSGPVTIFYDDFETDKGWVRNPFGTDTATKGLWERAIPEYTWWWGPKQMGSTTSGWYNLVTGAKAGLTPSSNDVDGGLTSIKSPAIALPSNGSLTLSFNYYFAYYSNASNADFFRVKVVGASTVTVLEELGSKANVSAYWYHATIDLSAFAGQTIYILIETADNANDSLIEAAVDDVRIVVNPHINFGENTINDK